MGAGDLITSIVKRRHNLNVPTEHSREGRKLKITLSGYPDFCTLHLPYMKTAQSVSATQCSRHLPLMCAAGAKRCTTMKGLSLPTEDTHSGRKSSKARGVARHPVRDAWAIRLN